jgi:RNA polymerase sigma factor (sigma-70 family)
LEREELIERLIARDEQAWRHFVSEFGGIVYGVASGFGFSEAERDDLFQNACIAALRAIETLRDPSRLATWFYRIAHRLAIDDLRRRREVSLEDRPQGVPTERILQIEPTVIRELEQVEEIARLYDALSHLDPRCRRLLGALYLEEPQPSYREVSRREKIPIGSIGPTRARCLEKARKLILKLSNDPSDPSILRDPQGSRATPNRRKGREG